MQKTLIVEDSATFRETFRKALCKRFPGMEVEEIPDGETLFEKMLSFEPMIVFLDIRLPGKNGLELIPGIKRAFPETRVIVLTAYDLPEYREAAFEGGADGFISKGALNLSDLAAMLDLE